MFTLIRATLIALFVSLSPAGAEDVRNLAQRLETEAMNGDTRAAYKLGLLFSNGRKISPDYISAREWFERAARQGYTRAMIKLADMTLEGKGTTANIDLARQWYEKAAKTNSPTAMTKLGELHAGRQDFEQSALWYRKAAIKGRPKAMRELGRYYYRGTGVHFDLRHAYAWLELAVQKGDFEAKALRHDIAFKKGERWVHDLLVQMERRMIPRAFWNAR